MLPREGARSRAVLRVFGEGRGGCRERSRMPEYPFKWGKRLLEMQLRQLRGGWKKMMQRFARLLQRHWRKRRGLRTQRREQQVPHRLKQKLKNNQP